MQFYRLMALSEDQTEFCIANYLIENQLEFKMEEAKENYPCASLWVEQELLPWQINVEEY